MRQHRRVRQEWERVTLSIGGVEVPGQYVGLDEGVDQGPFVGNDDPQSYEVNVETYLDGVDFDAFDALLPRTPPMLTVNGEELGRIVGGTVQGCTATFDLDPSPALRARMAMHNMGDQVDAWACWFALQDLAFLFGGA